MKKQHETPMDQPQPAELFNPACDHPGCGGGCHNCLNCKHAEKKAQVFYFDKSNEQRAVFDKCGLCGKILWEAKFRKGIKV